MRRISCLLLLWVVTSGLALGGDDWTGLWRVSRFYEGKLDGTYHLFFTGGGEAGWTVTAYTDDARPMILQEQKFSGSSLELRVANSVKQPLPLLFNLTREGDRLSGEWVFSQMQLMTPVTGEAVGFRVTASTQWTPWPFLPDLQKQGQTFIDLAGYLMEKAPRKKFEKFLDFWEREIELPYYFVVQSALYGAARSRDERQRVLEPFFETLQGDSASLDRLKEFPAMADRIQQAAQIQAGEATKTYLVNWPFLPDAETSRELPLWTRTPTPEEEAACACVLDLRERFFLADGLAFSNRGEAGGQWWEESLLREILWPRPAASIGVEVYRQGLVRLLALQGRGEAIPQLEDVRRAEMESEAARQLLAPLPDSPEQVEETTQGLVELGSLLAQHLIDQLSLEEALRRQDRDLVEDWQKFLKRK